MATPLIKAKASLGTWILYSAAHRFSAHIQLSKIKKGQSVEESLSSRTKQALFVTLELAQS